MHWSTDSIPECLVQSNHPPGLIMRPQRQALHSNISRYTSIRVAQRTFKARFETLRARLDRHTSAIQQRYKRVYDKLFWTNPIFAANNMAFPDWPAISSRERAWAPALCRTLQTSNYFLYNFIHSVQYSFSCIPPRMMREKLPLRSQLTEWHAHSKTSRHGTMNSTFWRYIA